MNANNANTIVKPGSRIGILGGGQLGRMLAMAAAELGYHVHIYCPENDAPASEVSAYTTYASYDDVAKLRQFAQNVDIVTYEFENIPAAPVIELAKYVPVKPSPDILVKSQHRVTEKTALHQLGVKTAPFMQATSLQELQNATAHLGFPCVLKTCRMGYDGKGQAMLKDIAKLEDAWNELSSNDAIVEGFIPFAMEISIIIARDQQGCMQSYCPVQNIHKNHILAETIAPAPISAALAQKAEHIANTIAEGFNLVGLMAIEMFVTNDDEILVNELAPRPHNSGHWTLDACITSQFSQTIRAICGLTLGKPERLCDARMLNLIGDDVNNWQNHLANPNAKLHLYGKKETRLGRKMGHVTILKSALEKRSDT